MDYSREWRETVTRQLEETARQSSATAVIQERIIGRLDSHDQRIKALEGSPDQWRGWIGTVALGGGCLFSAFVAPVVSVLGGVSVALIVYWLLHLPK